jgi:hypothetical protein
VSRQFTMVRGEDGAVSVTADATLHRFGRPGLEDWLAFVDGVSGQQTGTASLRLIRAIYAGKKADLDRLCRQFPALPTSVASEIAEMLSEEAKRSKR